MIYFKINDIDYSSFEQWSEMKLEKGIELSALCRTMPDKLKDFYTIVTSEPTMEAQEESLAKWVEAVGEIEMVKEFPEFYGKVISCLSNVPDDVIKFVQTGFRVAFYKQYCEKFVIGILHNIIDYQYQNIKSFTHEGIEYHLPVDKNILGSSKPMSDRSAIEFTESADLQMAAKEMAAGKFEYAANIISILCRPLVPVNPSHMPQLTEDVHVISSILNMKRSEIEPYDEQVSLARAESFKQLTMDIVFEVFFCLTKHMIIFNQTMAISLLEDQVKEKEKSLKAELNDSVGTHG